MMTPSGSDPDPIPRAWPWRMAAFVLCFTLLQLSWQGARGTFVEHLVVHDATVNAATTLVNVLTPQVHAQALGSAVHASGGGINVVNGCEGVEALFLLVAAFSVAPLPWRSRVLGLLCGLPVVFAVNQARILALFYSYRTSPGLFELLHGTVTPVAVILLVCGYFYAWLRSGSHAATTAR